MSRAFVKEDAPQEQPVLPSRAPLPDGAPNYVTPRGLRLLQDEKRELEEAAAREEDIARQATLRQRIAELTLRHMGARVIDLHGQGREDVRFGATIRLRWLEGEHAGEESEFTLVGVDEAGDSRISFYAPLAQALVGKRTGDRAIVETDHGAEAVEILSVRYDGTD